MTVDEHYINRLLARASQRSVKVFPKDVVSVTELVSICLRRAWYARRYPPKPTPYEALKLMGKALHQILQDELRADGWVTEVGVALHANGVKVVGRIDAVRFNEETGETEEVMEIKTVDELPSRPRPEHVLQLQAYMAIHGGRRGSLVYISRRDARVRVFKVDGNGVNTKTLAEMAKTVAEALQSDTPPDPVRGPWCSYCPYRWRCWGERA